MEEVVRPIVYFYLFIYIDSLQNQAHIKMFFFREIFFFPIL